jgi:formate dehydrogenase iron-sulfur subunit
MPTVAMRTQKAMLIDITLCVGCNACQMACKAENGLPDNEEKTTSPTAYTALEEHDGVYVRRLCQHCLEPTCVSVCPVGALEKTPEGPVIYDASKCLGCRYCIQACPFSVPRYEWHSTTPRVQKCRFCIDRIRRGEQPACAEACPTGATRFGDRAALVHEAMQRIQAEPGKYVNRIYGLDEVGGTSILYISNVPFDRLGFSSGLPRTPLPLLTHAALSRIPSVVALGGIFLYGIWWLTSRKNDVQKLEGEGRR